MAWNVTIAMKELTEARISKNMSVEFSQICLKNLVKMVRYQRPIGAISKIYWRGIQVEFLLKNIAVLSGVPNQSLMLAYLLRV